MRRGGGGGVDRGDGNWDRARVALRWIKGEGGRVCARAGGGLWG